jgi:hypothetical protein
MSKTGLRRTIDSFFLLVPHKYDVSKSNMPRKKVFKYLDNG